MFELPFLDLPALGAVAGALRLPGSKSLSNRALLLAALSRVIGGGLSVRQTEALVKAMSRAPRPKTEHMNKDNYLSEVQCSLSSVLARKVKVTGTEKGGRLIIEFFSKEDLRKLISAFDEE